MFDHRLQKVLTFNIFENITIYLIEINIFLTSGAYKLESLKLVYQLSICDCISICTVNIYFQYSQR